MAVSAGNTIGKASGSARSVVLLVLLAVTVAALVVGYIRNNALSGVVEVLPGLQEDLEGCGDLAAEYRSLRKQQVDPGGEDRYVRTLMEKIARELGIRKVLRAISESEVQRTDVFVETKYSTELRGVSLKNVVMFLYRIQASGKNLIPAEITVIRHKKSGKWTAHLAVHAVSALE